MSGWGCPYDLNGKCQRVPGRDCDIGMKGCVLFGRFTFADESKNISRRQKERRREHDPGRGPDEAGSELAGGSDSLRPRDRGLRK
jgi:hypothetical protein